jgi:hypothetical protein
MHVVCCLVFVTCSTLNVCVCGIHLQAVFADLVGVVFYQCVCSHDVHSICYGSISMSYVQYLARVS